MKRIAFNFGAALTAFALGVGCELALNTYLDAPSSKIPPSLPAHSQVIDLGRAVPKEQADVTHLPPGSLPVELERIDEIYRKRCQLPTDWSGDWPTIKQLTAFRNCNEQWTMARREAIDAELLNYMVRY